MADGGGALNPWLELDKLNARVALLERELAALRNAAVTPTPDMPPKPMTAAERQRAWRAAHPEQVSARNAARRVAPRNAPVTPCDTDPRNNPRYADVTQATRVTDGVTPRNAQNTEEKAVSSVCVTDPRNAAVTQTEAPPLPRPSLPPSALPSSLPYPLPTAEAERATPSPPQSPSVLSDPLGALETIAKASAGKFMPRASATEQRRLVGILAEHGCTTADLVALGKVIAAPPSWCKIRDRWTVFALLGKPDAEGKRGGGIITQLLAVALDRHEQALARNAPRPAPVDPDKAKPAAFTAKIPTPSFMKKEPTRE